LADLHFLVSKLIREMFEKPIEGSVIVMPLFCRRHPQERFDAYSQICDSSGKALVCACEADGEARFLVGLSLRESSMPKVGSKRSWSTTLRIGLWLVSFLYREFAINFEDPCGSLLLFFRL